MALKRICTLFLTGAFILSSLTPVFATYNSKKIAICPPAVPVITNETINEIKVIINNSELEMNDSKPYMKGNNLMVPLRTLIEKLGYEVKWEGQSKVIKLIKDNKWTMIKLNKDEYTNQGGKPISIGSIPEIKNSQTYVSHLVFSNVLNLNVKLEDTKLTISNTDDKTEYLSATAEVEEIKTLDKSKMILIKPLKNNYKDGIMLKINDETIIIDPITEKKMTFEDIKKGDTIYAQYSPIMTKSLPPISNAQRVEIINHVAITEGNITDIDLDSKKVLIDNVDGVHFMVNTSTVIVNEKGENIEFKNLTKDMKIRVYHDQMMTLMYPAKTGIKKIVVLNK